MDTKKHMVETETEQRCVCHSTYIYFLSLTRSSPAAVFFTCYSEHTGVQLTLVNWSVNIYIYILCVCVCVCVCVYTYTNIEQLLDASLYIPLV